jgi:hypothetical protein
VEIKPAQLAVVYKPVYVLLARVAVTRHVSRRGLHELEGAFVVEWMEESGGWDYCAVRVKVVVTNEAFVT